MGIFDLWKAVSAPSNGPSSARSRGRELEAVRSLPVELQHLPRWPTWLPETADGDGPLRGSRIGGRAFLLSGEQHPACGVCGSPLHLVVQLNSEELPAPVSAWTGPGIFQVFYCLSQCAWNADGWAPHSLVHRARRIDLHATGELSAAGRSAPARAITGWGEVEDLPKWRELPIAVPDELEDVFDEAERPVVGDKLDGWPFWVQRPEYTNCSVCGARMRMLFQVDSQDNLDWMWGDTGCAHLSVCPEHPDELAFGWACC